MSSEAMRIKLESVFAKYSVEDVLDALEEIRSPNWQGLSRPPGYDWVSRLYQGNQRMISLMGAGRLPPAWCSGEPSGSASSCRTPSGSIRFELEEDIRINYKDNLLRGLLVYVRQNLPVDEREQMEKVLGEVSPEEVLDYLCAEIPLPPEVHDYLEDVVESVSRFAIPA